MPIRILFFIETLTGGGAEKVLRDLVNHMNQMKFDITVQTVWPCDASKYLAQGIRYKTTYQKRNRVNLLRYRLEAELGLTYPLHIRDAYDIECAYLEMGTTKILSSSTNRKATKLAWVHCDLKKAVSDPRVFAKKTRRYYNKFDQILCVSQSVKDSFDELFDNQYASRILYNVVDDTSIREKAALTSSAEINKRRFTVLSVGRLSAPKNYIRLLKTHQRLLGEGIEHDLWILGDGPEREKLEEYVSENGLSNTVWMPGFIQNPYPFMRAVDLLACSSVYEGYSTFVTEGLILGKPLISTDVSGMRELLGESEYGMIVENNDDAFYQGMRQLLADPDLREHYAEKAAERGVYFSAETLTAETEAFFEKLVGEKH